MKLVQSKRLEMCLFKILVFNVHGILCLGNDSHHAVSDECGENDLQSNIFLS